MSKFFDFFLKCEYFLSFSLQFLFDSKLNIFGQNKTFDDDNLMDPNS